MTGCNPPVRGRRPHAGLAILVLGIVAAGGCRSAAPLLEPADLEAAREHLERPVKGDPAALYRLRVAGSGGLRMALLTSRGEGRLTVSEPFGSALSITAWRDLEPPLFLDLREGCRLEAVDLSQVLGIGAMPLPQAVRLLVGRLPTAGADRSSVVGGSGLLIEGPGWSARVEVAPEPWRIVAVRELSRGGDGWRIELSDHIGSVPGAVRIRRSDGRWAELELLSLQWNDAPDLPAIPDLPRCDDLDRGP
jgi:hypothetical protein